MQTIELKRFKTTDYKESRICSKKVNFSPNEPQIIPSTSIEIEPNEEITDKSNENTVLNCWNWRTKKLNHVDSKLLILQKEFNHKNIQNEQTYDSQNSNGSIYAQVNCLGAKRKPSFRNVQYQIYPVVEGPSAPRFERSRGGFDQENYAYDSFEGVEDRNNFVQKVYAILTAQLLVCFGIVLISVHVEDVTFFLLDNFALFVVSCIVFFITALSLNCCQCSRKVFPINLILMIIFTVSAGVLLSYVSCYYELKTVYLAILLTAIICTLVSLLACQMQYDITQCGCVLFIVLIALVIYTLICSILIFFVSSEVYNILNLTMAGISAILFICFLMYDTQMIMGGRKYEISPDDYIFGAICLFIDVIMIYQDILMLLGAR